MNSKAVVEILASNGGLIHGKSDEDYIFVGRFLSMVLLIENAIGDILVKVSPKSKQLTFGRKLGLFKETIKVLKSIGEDVSDYEEMLPSLWQLKSCRDKFAHDIRKQTLTQPEISQVCFYTKNRRPGEYEALEESKFRSNGERIATYIALYSFCVLERLCFLEYELE